LKQFYKEEFGKQGLSIVEDVLKKFEEGKKPYYQFTMDFDEMLETIKSVHGEFKLEFENDTTLYEEDFYIVN
jgi:hypothetical protein